MIKEAKYDVFISYSRSDYVYDRDTNNVPNPDSPISRLMEFLNENDITYWFDTKGIYLGDSFPKELKAAIINSKMLVFASSKSSNASKWTPREIGFADKHDKKILPFRIDDSLYGEDIEIYFPIIQHCNYYSNPEFAFDSLLKGIIKAKEEYQSKRKKEEENEKIHDIKKKIERQKKEYNELISHIKQIADTIADLEIAVGHNTKICPVCGDSVPINDYFCDTCGWTFVPSFRLGTEIEEFHLHKAKDIWKLSMDDNSKILELSSLRKQMSHKEEVLVTLNNELSSVKQLFEEEKTSRRKAEDELQRLIANSERETRAEDEKKPLDPFSCHEYVDLGLPSGLLWATCNLGANKPEQSGDYFAWGEIAPKDNYIEGTLKYIKNKKWLELSDDASRAEWGGNWRMPTHEEWVEVYDNCESKWLTQNGMEGCLFISRKNKKSIFLPAAGWRYGKDLRYLSSRGFYWSSSLYVDGSYYAYGCYFNSSDVRPSDWNLRYMGIPVRPVASPSPSRK